MKKRDFEQLKTKSAEELRKMSTEQKERVWNLKTDLAAGKVKNVREIRKLKQEIAQVLTILNQNKS